MTNLKCKQCGLVNPFNAPECKRCGSELVANANPTAPSDPDQKIGEDKFELKGCWGCMQALIFLSIAGGVTGYLGLFIREFLPDGYYPTIVLIGIFIPAAAVGTALGVFVLYVITRLIKTVKKVKGGKSAGNSN